MGVSLTDEVLRGMAPLGIKKNGQPFYLIMGGAPDGDDPDEDDPDNPGDEDDEDGDEDDEDDSDDEESKLAKDLAATKEESKQRRLKLREQRTKIAALEAQVAALTKAGEKKPDDKGDQDKGDKPEDSDAAARADKAERENVELKINLAFMADKAHTWHNPKAAMRLLDLSDVEIDDNGKIDGLEDAIKELAKNEPWLLKKSGSKDDDAGDEDQRPPAGSRTGRRKTQPQANRQRLVEKYGLQSHV